MNTKVDIQANLQDNYKNPRWIEENASDLLPIIEADLKNGGEAAIRAADDLLRIFPQLFAREDFKQWTRLLGAAAKQFGPRPDTSKNPMRPIIMFDTVYGIHRLDHTPPIQTKTKRRRRVRTNPRQIMETYLILTMSLYLSGGARFDIERVDELLDFSRRVNNPIIYNKLYQTVGFMMNGLGYPERAFTFAKMAYEYWQEQDNALEIGTTAFLLAQIYQMLEDFDQAEAYIEIASARYAETPHKQQQSLITLDKACLMLYREDYEAAEQWAGMAIQEFQELDLEPYVMLAHHIQGMIRAWAGKTDDAYGNIDYALRYYVQSDRKMQVAYVTHTLAFTDAKAHNNEDALMHLEENRRRLAELPDGNWKQNLLNKADKLEEAIHNGTVDDLKPYK
jgi:tetratricopeptide (TPR) repeat protein